MKQKAIRPRKKKTSISLSNILEIMAEIPAREAWLYQNPNEKAKN